MAKVKRGKVVRYNKWVCYENPAMDLYFIEDPDGYWLEILDR